MSSVSHVQNMSMMVKPMSYPCRYHPDQWCQNYCIEPKCFQALCAECIEEHLLHHKKTGLNDLYVKSFKSVRCDCSMKLNKVIDKLLQKLSGLHSPKNPSQLIEQVDLKLQNIRIQMHKLIDQEFFKIKEGIKGRVQESFSTINDLNQIHENLLKIINQLKQHNSVISEGIVERDLNVVDSIEKTIMLNQVALFDVFEKQSLKYQNKMKKIDVEMFYNQGIFKQGLLQSLKLGSSHPNTSTFGSDSRSPYQSKVTTARSRSKSPINDRGGVKGNSFYDTQSQIQAYQSKLDAIYPVIHYFQACSKNLHLIDLKNAQRGSPQHINIPLPDFIVPSFHASVLSQRTGSILISGGNVELVEEPAKSHIMSRFSLDSKTFKREYLHVKPRSSHTLCQDPNQDFVYILGGYGEVQDLGGQEQPNAKFQTTVELVNLRDNTVHQVRPSLWGGANMAIMSKSHIIKACMEGIQIYDAKSNTWTQVENIQSSHSYNNEVFCRGAGYGLIAQNCLLIYGGYTEDQQSRRDCYLMNINLSGFSGKDYSVQIKKNSSSLSIAEGFWNNPGIVLNGYMYAIQNVEDESGEPVESERHLIKYSLQEGKWSNVSIAKKKN